MIVYHWTSKKLAKVILREGLKRWSYVCRLPVDWHGEVCLEITLDKPIKWADRERFYDWQAVVPHRVRPENIRRL